MGRRTARSAARALFIAASLYVFVGAPFGQPSTAQAAAAACIPAAAQCCKICDAGQVCGNTCISRSKACHKSQGCTCDASNVCER